MTVNFGSCQDIGYCNTSKIIVQDFGCHDCTQMLPNFRKIINNHMSGIRTLYLCSLTCRDIHCSLYVNFVNFGPDWPVLIFQLVDGQSSSADEK